MEKHPEVKYGKTGALIVNLGHGLVPETDPDKLSKLIKFVREYK